MLKLLSFNRIIIVIVSLIECKRFEERMMAAMQRQPGEDTSNKNFYNGMLIASIVAAVALLALIIVLALYLKRTTTYKAIISGGKKSEYAFSNKAFTTVSVKFDCTIRDLGF